MLIIVGAPIRDLVEIVSPKTVSKSTSASCEPLLSAFFAMPLLEFETSLDNSYVTALSRLIRLTTNTATNRTPEAISIFVKARVLAGTKAG